MKYLNKLLIIAFSSFIHNCSCSQIDNSVSNDANHIELYQETFKEMASCDNGQLINIDDKLKNLATNFEKVNTIQMEILWDNFCDNLENCTNSFEFSIFVYSSRNSTINQYLDYLTLSEDEKSRSSLKTMVVDGDNERMITNIEYYNNNREKFHNALNTLISNVLHITTVNVDNIQEAYKKYDLSSNALFRTNNSFNSVLKTLRNIDIEQNIKFCKKTLLGFLYVKFYLASQTNMIGVYDRNHSANPLSYMAMDKVWLELKNKLSNLRYDMSKCENRRGVAISAQEILDKNKNQNFNQRVQSNLNKLGRSYKGYNNATNLNTIKAQQKNIENLIDQLLNGDSDNDE